MITKEEWTVWTSKYKEEDLFVWGLSKGKIFTAFCKTLVPDPDEMGSVQLWTLPPFELASESHLKGEKDEILI